MRWFVLVVLASCSIDESGEAPPDASPTEAGYDVKPGLDASPMDVVADVVTVDAPPDVAPPDCNATKKTFTTFQNLGTGVNTNVDEVSPSLTSDELTVYFSQGDDFSYAQLAYATRTSTAVPFGKASKVTTISGSTPWDMSVAVVGMYTTLYFTSFYRSEGTFDHLYSASGGSTNPDAWTGLSSSSAASGDPWADVSVSYCATSAELWLSSNRPGGSGSYDLWDHDGASTQNAGGGVNTGADEFAPTLSSDGLTLYYGRGSLDARAYPTTSQVWSATRSTASATSPFGGASHVTAFDSGPSINTPGWLSNDGCRMYFSSNRMGGQGNLDLWVATRVP